MALRDKKTVPLLQVGRWPHGSLGYWMAHYLLWLQQHNRLTDGALRTTSHPLERLHEWCHLRGLEQPEAITLATLESYQQRLYYWRKSNGEPLAVSTQCTHLAQIKRFFAWLAKRHILKANPASELELPKVGQRLPQDVLSPAEVENVLRQPDIHTVQGLRDRAILEVLYGSGLRRTELCQLTVNSINMEKGTVMVRQGKGKKDRLVPLGVRGCKWVRRYLETARPRFSGWPEQVALFLVKDGWPFTPGGLSRMVSEYLRQSGVRQSGSCHLFRHSMATHMLENGADIRWIQAMLGHSSITSTQVYTRVSIRALTEIHSATHPAGLADSETPPDSQEPDTATVPPDSLQS